MAAEKRLGSTSQPGQSTIVGVATWVRVGA